MGSGETRTGDFRKQAGLGSALYLAYKMRKKKEEDKYVKSDSASGQMMEHAASYGDIKIPWTPGAKAYFAEEKAKAIAKREANRRAEQLAIQNTDTLKPGRLTLLDRLNRLEETVSDKSKDVYGKVVNLIRDSKKKHTGAAQLAIQNTDTLKPGRLTLLDRLNRLEETVSDKSKDVYGKVVNLIRDSKKKHTGAAHGIYMHPLGDEPAASYGDIKSKSPFIAGAKAYLAEEKAKDAAKTEANSHPNPYKTMSARDMRLSTSEAARAFDGMGVNIYGLPPPDDNLNFKAKTEANSHPNPYRTMPKGLEYFPIVPKLNPEGYKLKLPSQSNSYPPSSSGANQSVAAGSEAGKQNPDSLGAELDNAIRRIKEQSRSFASNHGTALKVGGGVAAGLLLAYMLRSMTPKKKKRRHEEAY